MQSGAAQSHRTQTHPSEPASYAHYLNNVILETCSKSPFVPQSLQLVLHMMIFCKDPDITKAVVASASTKPWGRSRNSISGL